jgi:hypothetical protein
MMNNITTKKAATSSEDLCAELCILRCHNTRAPADGVLSLGA